LISSNITGGLKVNIRLFGVLLVLVAVFGFAYFQSQQQSVKAQRAAAETANYYKASGNSEILDQMPEIRSEQSLASDEERNKTGLLISLAVGILGFIVAASAKGNQARHASDKGSGLPPSGNGA